jgi:hypothetical protein
MRRAEAACLMASPNMKRQKKDSPISNVMAAGVVIKGK